VEDDLRKLGVKRWRTKALDKEEWASIVREAKSQTERRRRRRRRRRKRMTCRRFKFGCEQIFETLWPPSVHGEQGFSRFLRNTEAHSASKWPPHNRINSRFMDI